MQVFLKEATNIPIEVSTKTIAEETTGEEAKPEPQEEAETTQGLLVSFATNMDTLLVYVITGLIRTSLLLNMGPQQLISLLLKPLVIKDGIKTVGLRIMSLMTLTT